MIALRFLAKLPVAAARDLCRACWTFLTYDPACRWANLTDSED